MSENEIIEKMQYLIDNWHKDIVEIDIRPIQRFIRFI